LLAGLRRFNNVSMQGIDPPGWGVARRLTAGIFVLVLASNCAASITTDSYGVDLDGRPVSLTRSSALAIVLFFTASDCPIASRYEPEMQRLERKFSSAGIEFWWVYPNPGDTADVIRRHQSQFIASSRVIRDTQQSLTQNAHATVTPEAAIFIPANGTLREVYHGRIDDRYISFGQERPRALHHELEDAITGVLAGRAVAPPAGPPVGCSIVPLAALGK
jgi:hypothetical protein